MANEQFRYIWRAFSRCRRHAEDTWYTGGRVLTDLHTSRVSVGYNGKLYYLQVRLDLRVWLLGLSWRVEENHEVGGLPRDWELT